MTDDRETAHVMALNGHIGAVSAFNFQNLVVLFEACFELF